MTGLKMLSVITERNDYERYLQFFHAHGMNCIMGSFCKGTASDMVLACLGVERREKVLLHTFLYEEDVDEIRRALRTEMNINAAGNGIATFISIDGIGGKSAKKFLLGEEEKGVSSMDEKIQSDFVLIVTITNKGYNEAVMESAREAGARGGTVVKAQGTGKELTKFFGVSITEEKEMVYIVAPRKDRENIMRAIMEKAGVKTEAHGVVFSLPVDAVEGVSF